MNECFASITITFFLYIIAGEVYHIKNFSVQLSYFTHIINYPYY